MKKRYFKNKYNSKLEVNEKKFLLPMLTPTSKGTKYWEPSPKGGKLTKRYFGRVLLQLKIFLISRFDYTICYLINFNSP